MAVEIRMPQLSDTMETGTLVAWHVEEGDEIERGDILAEIETDKANMELEAFDEGVLLKKFVEEGEEAPTQALIAVIGEEGEDISDLLEGDEAPQEVKSEEGDEVPEGDESPGEVKDQEEPEKEGGEPPLEIESEEGAEPPEEEEEVPGGINGDQKSGDEVRPEESKPAGRDEQEVQHETSRGAEPPAADGRVRATPVARRMAARHGLRLAALEGSGPKGRVMKRDVEEALREGGLRAQVGEAPGEAAPSREVPAPSGEKRPSPLSEQKLGLTGMRETIAKRMTEAWQNVPHFNLQQELDMEPALAALEDLNADRGEEQRDFSVNDLLLMAVSRALCKEPRMNASFEGDHIRRYGQVDLAFAVAVEGGLFTPVIRQAETLPLESIQARSRELVEKARSGNMMPDDYQGGTFTVTNLGMYDVKNFSAVINPPQAGILAVGAVREIPVAEDGMVGVGKRMAVTLGCDHRAVDGVIGAQFLQVFKSLMEHPIKLFR